MKDIRNLNIWNEEQTGGNAGNFRDADIEELSLGVRAYHCLKRAGIDTVGAVVDLMENDERGLQKIRNLGARSEREIIEQVEEFRQRCEKEKGHDARKRFTVIKPTKKIWDTEISRFGLTNRSLTALRHCGIEKVRDLYVGRLQNEPGWFAVRELFDRIPSAR